MELSNNDILIILIDAKESYLKNNVNIINNGNFAVGMCNYIQEAILKHTMIYVYYAEIPNFIPEFIPETFNIDKDRIIGYWWSCSDTYSRVKAFNKLIKIYQNKV